MFIAELTTYGQSIASSQVTIDGVALFSEYISNIGSADVSQAVLDIEACGSINKNTGSVRILDNSSSTYTVRTVVFYVNSGSSKLVVAGYSQESSFILKTASVLNVLLPFDFSAFTNGFLFSTVQSGYSNASSNIDGVLHIENPDTIADDSYSVYNKAQVDSLLSSSIPADITNSELIGGFVRYNVSGTGNLSIQNVYGLFPYSSGTTTTLPAGTYLMRVRLRSTTANYSVTVNFGTPYTVTSSNGVIDDLRLVTLSSAQGFSATITQVAANTYIRVVIYEPGNVVTSVGPAAVTNDYNDLNNIPNGTLIIQKNGSNVASFSASANSNVTANISVPTTVASLSDASNYVTTNTAQTITGEKTFEDIVFHVDNAESDSDLVLDLYHYDSVGADVESSELTLRPVSDDFGNLGDYAHRYYNIWADFLHGTLYGNASSASILSDTRYIDGVGFNGSSNIAHYGECSTGASTQIKDVTIPNFNLVTGARVIVKFANTNTASSPQLRVNTSGTNGTAKSIVYRGTSAVSSSSSYYRWQAGSSIEFVYDGTNWVWVGFQEYSYYAYSANSSNYLYTSSGYYVAQAYYSNPTRAIVPYNSVATSDLGTASNRWRTLYLSTSISDGTNTYSLPSSSGTLALTSDIPEGIFCVGDSTSSGSIQSGYDYRPVRDNNSFYDNPKWRSSSVSIRVAQFINFSDNDRISVYVPTETYLGSIAFLYAQGATTYAAYPVYYRGNGSMHNATVPAGSVLRLTFRQNAFYTDFYDLADFGAEHEPIVRVGKLPHASNTSNYQGTLVGLKPDGTFDTLLRIYVDTECAGYWLSFNEYLLSMAENSPIYVSFQGECFSAHPRVPFGFITNLEYIYDYYDEISYDTIKFVYLENGSKVTSSATLNSYVVTNPKSGDRYFHVNNAPVYILYDNTSESNYHYISIGGIPDGCSGTLIGFLPASSDDAGLLRLVNTKFTSCSNKAEKVKIYSISPNANYPLVFTSSTGSSAGLACKLYTDTAYDIKYNPSSNSLTCENFLGHSTSSTSLSFKSGSSTTTKLTVTNTQITAYDDIIPNSTKEYDLGSTAYKWKHIYVAGSSSTDYYLVMGHSDVGNTYPMIRPNVDSVGYLGYKDYKFYSVRTRDLGGSDDYISNAYINSISTEYISDNVNRHNMFRMTCNSTGSNYDSVIMPCDSVLTNSLRTCTIGSESYPFSRIYTTRLSFSYYAATNGTYGSHSLYSGTYGIHCDGSLCPSTDTGNNLGNGQCRWSTLYSYYVGNSSYPINYGYFNYLYARNTLYVYNSNTSSYLSLSTWIATNQSSEQTGAIYLLLVQVTNNTASSQSIGRGALLSSSSNLTIGNIYVASVHQNAWTDDAPNAFDYVLSSGYAGAPSVPSSGTLAGVLKLLSSIYVTSNVSRYFLVLAVRVG